MWINLGRIGASRFARISEKGFRSVLRSAMGLWLVHCVWSLPGLGIRVKKKVRLDVGMGVPFKYSLNSFVRSGERYVHIFYNIDM